MAKNSVTNVEESIGSVNAVIYFPFTILSQKVRRATKTDDGEN